MKKVISIIVLIAIVACIMCVSSIAADVADHATSYFYAGSTQFKMDGYAYFTHVSGNNSNIFYGTTVLKPNTTLYNSTSFTMQTDVTVCTTNTGEVTLEGDSSYVTFTATNQEKTSLSRGSLVPISNDTVEYAYVSHFVWYGMAEYELTTTFNNPYLNSISEPDFIFEIGYFPGIDF